MKPTALILTLILVLTISIPAVSEDVKPLDIVAVNFPAFDFSRVIAGVRANVIMLLPPGSEAHSFEPSPKDIIAVQEADLLVYNGGIADFWISETVASLGAEAPVVLRMMDSVSLVTEELVEGMEDTADEHEQETEHKEDAPNEANADEELDEHVWTSPRNAKLIVSDIALKLSELDPAGREYYQARLAAYAIELDALDDAFRKLVNGAKRKTIVLGDRFPMRYFTMEYGLAYYAAFPGCSAQTEPSARTLAFLMDKISEEKIPVVFYIEFSSGKSASVIAEETGAKPLLLHSAHNVTLQEMQNGVSYLSLMRGNLETLREALY